MKYACVKYNATWKGFWQHYALSNADVCQCCNRRKSSLLVNDITRIGVCSGSQITIAFYSFYFCKQACNIIFIRVMLSILSVFFFLYRMSYKRSRCTIVHTYSTFRFKKRLIERIRKERTKTKVDLYVDVKLINNFYQCI